MPQPTFQPGNPTAGRKEDMAVMRAAYERLHQRITELALSGPYKDRAVEALELSNMWLNKSLAHGE